MVENHNFILCVALKVKKPKSFVDSLIEENFDIFFLLKQKMASFDKNLKWQTKPDEIWLTSFIAQYYLI